MSRSAIGALALLACVTSLVVQADMEVVGPDGRYILLRDDYTWEYVERETVPEGEAAVLVLERVKPQRTSCKLGLRLTNNLPYVIRSLVPRFSAYTEDDVLYESVSLPFEAIKPTQDLYRELRFSGITCDQVAYVLVHGGDRCVMGPFTKFNYEKGECLKYLVVKPSDRMEIRK